jgi:hypothetical protein
VVANTHSSAGSAGSAGGVGPTEVAGSSGMRTTRSDAVFGEQLAELEFAFGQVRAVVRQLEPDTLSGDQAMAMAEVLSGFEPVVASGVARLTPRVTSCGTFTKGGFTSAQDWLGAATGTSAGAAKSRLAAAEGAAKVAGLGEALREGTLSSPQLGLLAGAEVAAPGAAKTLLELLAGRASHQELSDEAARLKAAALSREQEHQRRARIHAARYFRWHQDKDGGIRGDFFCDEVAWAKVAPALEAEAKRRWKASGADDGATFDALRLDAFIDLLGRPQPGQAGKAGQAAEAHRPQVVVLVDAEALRRGTNLSGEICEIDGIGPVPVEAVVELLGEGAAQILVKEGTDIRSVTSSSRRLAQKTLIALIARDRTCVVKDCGNHLGLERDHCVVDFAADGPTTFDNLARLCPRHHHMKTVGGWILRRGPDSWTLDPPPDPPSDGALGRARRLAAAKAKAKAKATTEAKAKTEAKAEADITSSSKSSRNQPQQQ